MVAKKKHKSPNPRLTKTMDKEALPEIRYGTQRMNVLNHTISHKPDWSRI